MRYEMRFNRRDAFGVIARLGKMFEGLDDCDYVLTVEKYRKKRSLDANAYFWMLLGKLAEVRGLPGTTELYRHYIKEVGVREVYTGCADAIDKLAATWGGEHLGNIAIVRDSIYPGKKVAVLYFGSSYYNTEQMSRLIELVVQDCQAVGIDTMTTEERSLLCQKWGERQ